MTLRDLASPRFFASLIADFDLGRVSALGATPSATQLPAVSDLNEDDFEETRPCPWYVTVTEDPPSALR